MMRHLTYIVLMCLLLVASGCGRYVTAEQWGKELRQYLADYGRDDPASLWTVVDARDRPTFTVLGGTLPTHGNETRGYLVDVIDSGRRTWLVYALAEINQQQVRYIRPAAVTRDKQAVRCVVGPLQSDTDQRYLRAAEKDGATTTYGLEPLAVWPRPGDRFDASITGSTLTLSERRSGARWTMTLLPHSPRTAHK